MPTKPNATSSPASTAPAAPRHAAKAPDSARWTPAQAQAITTTDAALLVSAAAGSGKTTVLAQRCVYLVCDAPETCNVSDLLVVTFTKLAAAEMRSRIEKSLRERVARLTAHDPQRNRLLHQLRLVDHASISTLDSFCTRLVRQHFQKLDLDPAFRVLDEDEALLMRNDVASQLMLEQFETASQPFLDMVQAYGNGEDQRIISQILRIDNLAGSLVNRSQWISLARKSLADASADPSMSSALAIEYIQTLASQIESLVQQVDQARAIVLPLVPKYAPHLDLMEKAAKQWFDACSAGSYDALCLLVADTKFPKMPPVANSVPGKQIAKAQLETLKEVFESLGKQLRFTAQDWQKSVALTLPHANLLLDLAVEFSRRYTLAKRAVSGLDFADLAHFTLRLLTTAPVDQADPSEASQKIQSDITSTATAGTANPSGKTSADRSTTQTASTIVDPLAPEPDADLPPSDIALACHRRFRHVLVDEYQDNNALQDAIIRLLSTECVAAQSHQPANLFCVGDVKQSIYGFRLADPQRFLQRQVRYRADGKLSRVIDLRENFRSRGPLLLAVNAVFERLMTRQTADIDYDVTHALVPGLDIPSPEAGCFTGAPVELHILPEKSGQSATVGEGDIDTEIASDGGIGDEATAARGSKPFIETTAAGVGDTDATSPAKQRLTGDEIEALIIAHRIKQLMGQADDTPRLITTLTPAGPETRPIRYSDIVVLLRAMGHHAQAFADVLRREGIPVYNDAGAGFFESMEIRDILNLLTLLDNAQQDFPLAAFLRSPLTTLADPEDLMAQVRLAADKFTGPDRDGRMSFHQAINWYATTQTDDIAAALRDVLMKLDQWRDLSMRRPIAEVLWTLYDTTGYLAYCAGLRDGQQRVANLINLHQRAQQFGGFLRQGLWRFLRFMESLRQEKDIPAPSATAAGQNAVTIRSIHNAKGLEWPVVILPTLGKGLNTDSLNGDVLLDREVGIGMKAVDLPRLVKYPSLAYAVIRDRLRRQMIAEELRILYVAMTRAREHLILIATGKGKEDLMDNMVQRYAHHAGPLPAQEIIQAGSPFKWIVPAAIAAGPEHYAIRQYSVDEVKALSQSYEKQSISQNSTTESELAAMLPLAIEPPADPVAEQVIARLAYRYPHEPSSKIPAATSATYLSHAHPAVGISPDPTGSFASADITADRPLDASTNHSTADALLGTSSASSQDGFASSQNASAQDALSPATPSQDASSHGATSQAAVKISPFLANLPEASFAQGNASLSATDRGTATHLLLEHLDFAAPCDMPGLTAQLSSLGQRHILTDSQIAAVELGQVHWFLLTSLGRALQANAQHLLRELPFYLPIQPSEAGYPAEADGSGLDRIMLRGRLDLALPTLTGLEIIDYKTDRIHRDRLAERVAFYRPQMALYRRALQNITQRPVTAIHLVFFHLHHIDTWQTGDQ